MSRIYAVGQRFLGTASLAVLTSSTLWAAQPPASPSGGAALQAWGGVSVTADDFRKMRLVAQDPCSGPAILVPPPPVGDSSLTPPVAIQWKACFPAQGGLTADPQIAAGHTRLLVANQTRLAIYDKPGTYRGSTTAATLFAPLHLDNGTSAGLDLYRDLRAVYDPHRQRFWVTATASNGRQLVPARRRVAVTVAVSKTADPLDGWWLYWWDAVTGYGDAASPVYQAGDVADDPFIGIDAFGIHQTNRVVNGALNRYWRVAFFPGKALANGAAAPVTGGQYWDLLNPAGTKAWVVQPVVHHGASPRTYYASRQGNHQIVVWALTDPLLPAQKISRVAVTMADAWNPPPDAPQAGSSQDLRMSRLGGAVLKAVYRSGRLHLVTNDAVDWFQDGQLLTSVRLIRLNVSGYPLIPTSLDTHIGKKNSADDGPLDHMYYGWPGLAVNSSGTMAVVYARSGSPIFPEMRWSVHYPNEVGARGSRLVKAGEAAYAISGSNAAVLPWGETAGASVDPFDDQAVWIAHQYADAAGGAAGNYEIWVAKVLSPAVRPDIHMLFIEVDPQRTDPGMPIDIVAAFGNQGDGPVEGLTFDASLVRADGLTIPLGTFEHGGVGPGQTARLRETFTVPRETPAGRYVVRLVADPRNQIVEYDEENNTALSGTIEVVAEVATR